MKRYYVATFVVVLCFMSCGQSQEEKLEFALREVERLDAMRKKVNEILGQQTSNLMLKTNEYEDWKMSQDAIILIHEADMVQAEQRLVYWKNWHIREEKGLKLAFEMSPQMIAHRRQLYDLRVSLSATRKEATDDSAYAVEILPSITNKRMRAVYIKALSAANERVTEIKETIKAHESNRPKPSYKRPQKRTDKISEWENRLSDAKELHRVTVEDMKSIDTAKLQNLDKLRMDLLFTKASYDSINVLHTKVVLELSKK